MRAKRYLCLAVAAEYVDQLVTNQLFDVSASGLQIFSGVELVGFFVEELSDSTGHCKTEVRVDIDFTY